MTAFFHASWLPVLGWTLLHSLWEGALVALASALVLRSLRGASPRLRYVVAVAGLLTMTLLPLRHLVSFRREAAPIFTLQTRMEEPTPAPAKVLPAPPQALRTRVTGTMERAMPWVVLAWIAGACLSLLRLAGGWVWLQRLRWRKAELAPDGLQRMLLDLCRRAGLKRAVTLLMCEGLAGPSVVGILRPAILVPAGWFLNLPPEHVEALLAHELAHVLRHDYAVNLLQSLVEVLLFYHPGVWWLSRRIRAERELACDTFAVGLMGDALPLAEALTDLERRGLGRASLEPAPAAHGGSLMDRISHLLLPPRRSSSAPAFGAMALLGLVLASTLRLMAQTHDPTPSVPPIIPHGRGGALDASPTGLYIRSRNATDKDGNAIPYSQLLDVKAALMPLNQVWMTFERVIQDPRPDKTGQTWASPSEKVGGPRVNIDLRDAIPSDVLQLLNRLARDHGVAPYQAPAPTDLPNIKVTKHTLGNGQILMDFHARQVSTAYLDTLLAAAKPLADDAGCHDGSIEFDRDADTFPGPKVDALFEGLTIPELEARIRELKLSLGMSAPSMPLPAPGRTIDHEAAFYIQSRCAKDSEGRDIPFTQVLDIKANQVPLNQIWGKFKVAVEYGRSSTLGPRWARRDSRIPGPRVNIDLDGAKPEEVLALLNHLAKVHGVAPYEAPTGAEPGPFEVDCYLLKDGKQVINLHARQVSLPFLNQLMATARNLKAGVGTATGRDADTYPGPKVDAIFEGLTLQELEARIRKIQAEAR